MPPVILQYFLRVIPNFICIKIYLFTFYLKNKIKALRIMSVRPNYGPSSGETLISLLGTGFAETSKQALRFTFKTF